MGSPQCIIKGNNPIKRIIVVNSASLSTEIDVAYGLQMRLDKETGKMVNTQVEVFKKEE